MKSKRQIVPSLREIEEECVAEGREWTRRRLEARLQRWADEYGAFSPCGSASTAAMQETHLEPEHDDRQS